MQTLSVLAVEDGAIIVASPAGERFRLPVDAALRARIASPTAQSDEKRLSPREIQAHVRAGLTAEQVAAMTGVPVAFIERFVGPVLAERAYIVESALAVRLPPETEGARARTFGAVMGERLDALAAEEVRWTSAKEPSGWILAVAFRADDVQHAARWRFDPKHMRLDADNVEASTLSQQGVPAALTPRLRAIEPTAPVTIVPPVTTPVAAEPAAPRAARPPQPHGARVAPVPPAEPDRTRFDSAVFRFPPIEPGPEQDRDARRRPAADGDQQDPRPATDEIDQLHRRRGERRPAPEPPAETDALPVTRAMDVVEPGDVFAPRPKPIRDDPAPQPGRRDPAPVQRLPVRAPQDPTPTAAPPAPQTGTSGARQRAASRAPQQGTAPIPPAFLRGPASGGRPADATPERAEDRPTEPLRRRRERGRAGLVLEPVADEQETAEPEPEPAAPVRPRRGRTSMPSWDEIVFGRDEQ
ncbi:septation protein SepH [Amnibacterium kyonggiense]